MAAKTNRKANGIAKRNGALRVLVVGVGNMGAHLGRGRDYKLCVLKAEGLDAAHWAEIEAVAPS
jgi:hypothetical protein